MSRANSEDTDLTVNVATDTDPVDELTTVVERARIARYLGR